MSSSSAKGSVLGACVFLGIASLIIWTASVASWVPFADGGYKSVECYVSNVSVLNCGAGGTGNVFAVSYTNSSSVNQTFLAIAVVYSLFVSPNVSAAQRLAYPCEKKSVCVCVCVFFFFFFFCSATFFVSSIHDLILSFTQSTNLFCLQCILCSLVLVL